MAKFRKFNITTKVGTEEVDGLAITIEGVKCFIFWKSFHWNVSHRETGMFIASHDDRKKAIERAKIAISDAISHKYAREAIAEHLERAADNILLLKLGMPIEKWQELHNSIRNIEIILK